MNDNKIYLVGGAKGGTGKSMICMALIDYLETSSKNIFLVETDTANPDVWKSHKEHFKSELVDLDSADGWIQLVNTCDSNQESIVVINTGARNNKGVSDYGAILSNTLVELKRDLVTLWVINRQRDSLELLKEYTTTMPNSESHTLHVIKNGYFGDNKKYELYNNSKIKSVIESAGGKSLMFSDLADRVSDDIYTQRISINKASRELPIGNRAELQRWRSEYKKMFSEII
ncbi:MAG: protein mobD [Methylococcaceae bacterium]